MQTKNSVIREIRAKKNDNKESLTPLNTLATKKDLQILEANVTARIIRWVAGMLVAQAAIVATLVKLL